MCICGFVYLHTETRKGESIRALVSRLKSRQTDRTDSRITFTPGSDTCLCVPSGLKL